MSHYSLFDYSLRKPIAYARGTTSQFEYTISYYEIHMENKALVQTRNLIRVQKKTNESEKNECKAKKWLVASQRGNKKKLSWKEKTATIEGGNKQYLKKKYIKIKNNKANL